MSVREVVRPMTRSAAPALLALLVLLPLAAPFAAAAPTSFTINVVSAMSHGCSPDVWTSPDLRVRVLVNGAPVATTGKADQQDEPVFAVSIPASATLPVTIGIEAEEAEPAGFFGTSTEYLACTVGPGGATRAEFTYNGEEPLTRVLRGDDGRAAEVFVVVGRSPPPVPSVTATTTTSSVTLSWAADPTGQATGHRVALGGVGAIIESSVTGNTAVVTGLCDNTAYTYRVIRDTTTWHVSSADVTFTTKNSAPQAPAVLSTTRAGNVSFDSPTTHDVERYEIHASATRGFTPSDATLRKTVSPSFIASRQVDVTGVAFAASDAFVVVRVVDTGNLSADSMQVAIGGPTQDSPYGTTDACGAAAPAPPVSRPSTSSGSTSSPTSGATASDAEEGGAVAPEEDETCCYSFTASVETNVSGALRVTSGASFNLTIQNTGTRQASITLAIVDDAGEVTFAAAADPVVLPPNATRRVEVAVRAEHGTSAAEDLAATLQLRLVENGNTSRIALLVDIPELVVDLATEDIGAVFEVKVPTETLIVPIGGSLRVKVLVVNKADHEFTAEVFLAPSTRHDADIGRAVVAHGFEAKPDQHLLRLAPYSKQEIVVTLTAPLNATVGESVGAQLRFVANNSVIAEDVPAEFAVQAAAPVEVTSEDGVKLDATAILVIAGAGTAAAGVGAAVWARRDSSRWLLAVALYARIAKSDTLQHEGRESLRRMIEASPGICYSDLKRETGMNTGAIVHHLRTLERAGFVTSRREGAFRRFYAVGSAPQRPELVRVDGALTPAQARVVDALRAEPLTQGQLAERLGLSQQGTSHHVKALERSGHIEAYFDGRVWRYRAIERVDVPR